MFRTRRAGLLLLSTLACACSGGPDLGLPGAPQITVSGTLTGDPAERPSGANRLSVPCGWLGVGWQASKMAFTPDGTELGIADGSRVKILRVSDWTPVKELPPGAQSTSDFAFTAGGMIAAITSDLEPKDPTLDVPVSRLYRIDDGSVVTDFTAAAPEKTIPAAVTASADGTVLANLDRRFSDNAMSVTVRSMPAMTVTATLAAGTFMISGSQGPSAIALSPKGDVLAVSFDNEVDLYQTSDGTKIKALTTAGGAPVLFSPNGKYIASHLGTVAVDTGAAIQPTSSYVPPRSPYGASAGGAVTFSADSKTLFSGGDTLSALVIEPGGPTPKFAKGTTPEPASARDGYYGINALAATPDGTLLISAGRDAELEAWKTSDGTRVRAVSGHVNWVESIAASGDGKTFVSTANRPDAIVWDVATSSVKATLPFAASFTGLSNDGSRLMQYDLDATDIDVLSTPDGKTTQTFNAGSAKVTALSPDGTLVASGHSDGGVRLLRVTDGSLARTLHDFDSEVESVSFSKDGSRVAAGWLRGATVWNVADGSVALSALVQPELQAAITSATLSPDGTVVAVTGGGAGGGFAETAAVALVRVADGAIVWSKTADWSKSFGTPSFSPDGRRIATPGTFHGATLWSTDDGTPLFELDTGWTLGVFMTSSVYASGEEDGTVAKWCLP